MTRAQVAAGPLRDLVRRLASPPSAGPSGDVATVDPSVLAVLRLLVPADAVVFEDLGPDGLSVRARSSTHAVLRQHPARELTLPLPGPPGHRRRIRFLRLRGKDFDDTDRALAALVRPHLVAHLHALDLSSRGVAPLTGRQRQLLSLVSDGFSNAQVARTLGIADGTVRTHLQQIYTRLGVTSRSEAVALVTDRPDQGWGAGGPNPDAAD